MKRRMFGVFLALLASLASLLSYAPPALALDGDYRLAVKLTPARTDVGVLATRGGTLDPKSVPFHLVGDHWETNTILHTNPDTCTQDRTACTWTIVVEDSTNKVIGNAPATFILGSAITDNIAKTIAINVTAAGPAKTGDVHGQALFNDWHKITSATGVTPVTYQVKPAPTGVTITYTQTAGSSVGKVYTTNPDGNGNYAIHAMIPGTYTAHMYGGFQNPSDPNDAVEINFTKPSIVINAGGDPPVDLVQTTIVDGTNTTPSPSPAGSTTPPSDCEAGAGFTWIICGVIHVMVGTVDYVRDNILVPFLKEPPLDKNDPSIAPIYSIWSAFRNVASVFFILVFFLIIFGTALGFDNYTIKKVLPHLIAGAILVPFSWYICVISIDIGNILGQGLVSLMGSIIPAPAIDFTSSWSKIFFGGAIGLGAVGAAIALTQISLGVIITAAIAFLVAVVTLVLRKIIIILLIVLSPFALLAWVLPNTEKWFKQWWSNLIRLIMMYPLMMMLFEIGRLFSTVAGTVVGSLGNANAHVASSASSALIAEAGPHAIFHLGAVAGLASLLHLADIASTTTNAVKPIAEAGGLIIPLFLFPSTYTASGKLMNMAASAAKNVGGSANKKYGKDSEMAKDRALNRRNNNLLREANLNGKAANSSGFMKLAYKAGAIGAGKRSGLPSTLMGGEAAKMRKSDALASAASTRGKFQAEGHNAWLPNGSKKNKQDTMNNVTPESMDERIVAEQKASLAELTSKRATRAGLLDAHSDNGNPAPQVAFDAMRENAMRAQSEVIGGHRGVLDGMNLRPQTGDQIAASAAIGEGIKQAQLRGVTSQNVQSANDIEGDIMGAAAATGITLSPMDARLQRMERHAHAAAGHTKEELAAKEGAAIRHAEIDAEAPESTSQLVAAASLDEGDKLAKAKKMRMERLKTHAAAPESTGELLEAAEIESRDSIAGAYKDRKAIRTLQSTSGETTKSVLDASERISEQKRAELVGNRQGILKGESELDGTPEEQTPDKRFGAAVEGSRTKAAAAAGDRTGLYNQALTRPASATQLAEKAARDAAVSYDQLGQTAVGDNLGAASERARLIADPKFAGVTNPAQAAAHIIAERGTAAGMTATKGFTESQGQARGVISGNQRAIENAQNAYKAANNGATISPDDAYASVLGNSSTAAESVAADKFADTASNERGMAEGRVAARQAVIDRYAKEHKGAPLGANQADSMEKAARMITRAADTQASKDAKGQVLKAAGQELGVQRESDAAIDAEMDRAGVDRTRAIQNLSNSTVDNAANEADAAAAQAGGKEAKAVEARDDLVKRTQLKASIAGKPISAAAAHASILATARTAAGIDTKNKTLDAYGNEESTIDNEDQNGVSVDDRVNAARYVSGKKKGEDTGKITGAIDAMTNEAAKDHTVAGSTAAFRAASARSAGSSRIATKKQLSESYGKEAAAIRVNKAVPVSAAELAAVAEAEAGRNLAQANGSTIESAKSIEGAEQELVDTAGNGIKDRDQAKDHLLKKAGEAAGIDAGRKTAKDYVDDAGYKAGYEQSITNAQEEYARAHPNAKKMSRTDAIAKVRSNAKDTNERASFNKILGATVDEASVSQGREAQREAARERLAKQEGVDRSKLSDTEATALDRRAGKLIDDAGYFANVKEGREKMIAATGKEIGVFEGEETSIRDEENQPRIKAEADRLKAANPKLTNEEAEKQARDTIAKNPVASTDASRAAARTSIASTVVNKAANKAAFDTAQSVGADRGALRLQEAAEQRARDTILGSDLAVTSAQPARLSADTELVRDATLAETATLGFNAELADEYLATGPVTLADGTVLEPNEEMPDPSDPTNADKRIKFRRVAAGTTLKAGNILKKGAKLVRGTQVAAGTNLSDTTLAAGTRVTASSNAPGAAKITANEARERVNQQALRAGQEKAERSESQLYGQTAALAQAAAEGTATAEERLAAQTQVGLEAAAKEAADIKAVGSLTGEDNPMHKTYATTAAAATQEAEKRTLDALYARARRSSRRDIFNSDTPIENLELSPGPGGNVDKLKQLMIDSWESGDYAMAMAAGNKLSGSNSGFKALQEVREKTLGGDFFNTVDPHMDPVKQAMAKQIWDTASAGTSNLDGKKPIIAVTGSISTEQLAKMGPAEVQRNMRVLREGKEKLAARIKDEEEKIEAATSQEERNRAKSELKRYEKMQETGVVEKGRVNLNATIKDTVAKARSGAKGGGLSSWDPDTVRALYEEVTQTDEDGKFVNLTANGGWIQKDTAQQLVEYVTERKLKLKNVPEPDFDTLPDDPTT